MIGKQLVRALEDDWKATLDAVARTRGWPTSSDVARLGEKVAKLSREELDQLDTGSAQRGDRNHDVLQQCSGALTPGRSPSALCG